MAIQRAKNSQGSLGGGGPALLDFKTNHRTTVISVGMARGQTNVQREQNRNRPVRIWRIDIEQQWLRRTVREKLFVGHLDIHFGNKTKQNNLTLNSHTKNHCQIDCKTK